MGPVTVLIYGFTGTGYLLHLRVLRIHCIVTLIRVLETCLDIVSRVAFQKALTAQPSLFCTGAVTGRSGIPSSWSPVLHIVLITPCHAMHAID